LSAQEFNLWKAEYIIEPFGEERSDLRAATIVQSNILPHTKDKVKLKDCLLNFDPPEKQDWRQWQAALAARANAINRKKK